MLLQHTLLPYSQISRVNEPEHEIQILYKIHSDAYIMYHRVNLVRQIS